MNRYTQPPNICKICGISRTAKGSDHSQCSAKLQSLKPKRANKKSTSAYKGECLTYIVESVTT